MRNWIIGGLLVMGIAGGSEASAAKPRRPNVIFLSVDTLRADHLGIYGYPRNTSPHLDQLLSRGTLFRDASTNIPLTNPSFCSLFTSRYPHQIGATRNGIRMLPNNETLPQILQRHGYQTAAILSNWPLKAHLSGLEPGFDLYDDNFFQKRWLIFHTERDAQGVTEQAAAWLAAGPTQPFFLWVHYSDPHAPYLHHKEFSFRSPPRRLESHYVDDYDSEIAYTDYWIGQLLEALSAAPFASRTLIVFLADHGESLGEHSYLGHGRNLYQPSLRVPLGFIGPGIPLGRRLDFPVQLLDLAPTLLAYLDLPAGSKMLGLNLLPLIQEGTPPADRRPIYFETYPGAVPQVKGAKELVDAKTPLWIGFRDGAVKIIYSPRLFRWEWYQLRPDPRELHNLAKPTDPHFISCSERLLAWFNHEQNSGWVANETESLTEEDRRQLESLGYLAPSPNP